VVVGRFEPAPHIVPQSVATGGAGLQRVFGGNAMRAVILIFLLGAAASPAAAQDARPAIPALSAPDCTSNEPTAVIVCGRTVHPYRIDPNVLAAERALDAPPIKPPVTADSIPEGCVGPKCGEDSKGVVPVIGMALVAASAAAMALDGDDWRNAFQTQQDAYRAYLEAKTREKQERKVKFLGGIFSN